MPRGGKRAGAGRKKRGNPKLRDNEEHRTPCMEGHLGGLGNKKCNIGSNDSNNQTGQQPREIGSQAEIGRNDLKENQRISNQNEPKEIDCSNQHVSERQSTSDRRIEAECGEKAIVQPTGSQDLGEKYLSDITRKYSEVAGLDTQRREVGPDPIPGRREEVENRGRLENNSALHPKSSGENHRGRTSSTNSSSHTSTNATTTPTALSFNEQTKRLRDPIYFARAYCLKSLDEWQSKLLANARKPCRVALRGANGIGKTVIICVLILFFLSTIRNCRVVIVSGVFRQLKMMVDHLQSLLKNFKGWRVLRGSHELLTPFPENKAIWFSTDSPGAAQGQHSVVEGVNWEDQSAYDADGSSIQQATKEAKDNKSCLVLIRDECRDIPDGVKASTDTFQADWTFDFSCPGNSVGWFHQIFTTLADIYQIHHVTAYESSYVTKEHIESFKKMHPEGSARFKNSILAEFSDVDIKNLITIDQITRCFNNPQPWRNPGYKKAGIDLSAAKKGGDEMWCVPAQGNKLFQPYKLPYCSSEMEAVGLVVRWLKAEGVKYVFCDNGGLGSPMISRLEEVLRDDESIKIVRVNFGGSAINPAMMAGNRGTELWLEGANKIELRDIIFSWDEQTKSQFVAQATSRQTKPVGSDGIITLESKAKCARSPDLVDATFLAICEPPKIWPFKIGNTDFNDFRMPGGSDDDGKHSYNVSHDGYSVGGSF